MLRWRLVLGGLIVAALALFLWQDARSPYPGAWLLPVWLVFCGLAAGELVLLCRAGGFNPVARVLVVGSLAVVAANGWAIYWPDRAAAGQFAGLGPPAAVLSVAVAWAFLEELVRYRAPGRTTVHLSQATFALAYVGILGSTLVQLRLVGSSQLGLLALVSLLVIVKMSDIGAYTGGRLFGRHKLAPRISPGKTIEGAVAGLLFAVLGGWLVFWHLAPWLVSGWSPPPIVLVVIYSLGLGLAGMLGDLAESLIKRDLGRKDSSTWLPGFGGVLDMVDSVLLAAPLAYLSWTLGLFAA